MPRLFLSSTPRSGNTWVRRMLARALGLQETAVHTPSQLDWISQPADVIVQMHWRWSSNFEALLRSHGFQTICVIRHPLDVLVSILHFCAFEPQTTRWLDGASGDETSILDATPVSREFSDYCLSERASQLLAVSVDWARAHDQSNKVPVIRYESLVSDPVETLVSLLDEISLAPVTALEAVVAEYTLDRSRQESTNHHFWMGQPGLWRRLLPAEIAKVIGEKHRGVLDALGYECNPDPALGVAEAERAWGMISQKRRRT